MQWGKGGSSGFPEEVLKNTEVLQRKRKAIQSQGNKKLLHQLVKQDLLHISIMQRTQASLMAKHSRPVIGRPGIEPGYTVLVIVVIQLLSRVQLFATPWNAACQASLSITNSWSLLKLMSIELVMPSNHLILRHPLLPPSIFSSIRVFFNESVLRIRWPKYWSFSFSIGSSNEYSGLIYWHSQ